MAPRSFPVGRIGSDGLLASRNPSRKDSPSRPSAVPKRSASLEEAHPLGPKDQSWQRLQEPCWGIDPEIRARWGRRAWGVLFRRCRRPPHLCRNELCLLHRPPRTGALRNPCGSLYPAEPVHYLYVDAHSRGLTLRHLAAWGSVPIGFINRPFGDAIGGVSGGYLFVWIRRGFMRRKVGRP